ncbi:MAG TPA: Ig-like domain-containing protein, partial [Thermoanaerobaculia bacterium]
MLSTSPIRTRAKLTLAAMALGISFYAPAARAQQGVAAAISSPQKLRTAQNGIAGRYIVVLVDQFSAENRSQGGGPKVAEVADELARLHSAKALKVWDQALPGFLVDLPPGTALVLSHDPRVRFVEQDAEIQVQNVAQDCNVANPASGSGPFPSPPQQSILCADPRPGATGCFDNWGLDRIDERVLGKNGSGLASRDGFYRFDLTPAGVTVHAYTIDTGITPGHQEFLNASGASRVGTGVNAVADLLDPNRGNFTDCVGNSHGTHVFGILGGKTYGVAKDVTLHSIKANQGCAGGIASISTVVEGINWILANHDFTQPAVVNMSANSTDLPASSALALAMTKLIERGISFVQSAGNDNSLAAAVSMAGPGYPTEIIIAGGSDEKDGRWIRDPTDPLCTTTTQIKDCGSNYGSAIDIWAPASNIVSASRASSTAICTLSGTSMAAPHVTGAAAILLGRFPKASPSTVEKALKLNGTAGALSDAQIGPAEKLLNTRFPTTGGPVAGDVHAATNPNAAVDITFAAMLAGDLDWDHDALSVVSFGTSISGQVQLLADHVHFTPTSGFTGEATFPYTITDGHGNNDTGTIRVRVAAAVRPPVAVDDYFNSIAINSSLPIADSQYLANDFSPDGHVVAFKEPVTSPQHGTLILEGTGQRRYTPNAGFKGTDSFVYRIDDQTTLLEADATVFLTVGNHPPTPNPDSLVVNRDTQLTVPFTILLANDSDPDADSLLVKSYDLATAHGGSNSCCASGGFVYSPPPGFVGSDQFTYTVSDRTTLGGLSATAVVTILVKPTQYEGNHETADCNSIVGWAWDRLNPSNWLNVNIFDGSVLVATVPANQFRPDLQAAGIGDGIHGFSMPTPTSLKNGQPHSIRVKFADTGGDLSATPKTLNCTLSYEGYQDQTACSNIAGWAWFPSQPNTPINVDIYDSATKIATVAANLFRSDLLSAGKGNGNHGFVYPTPSALRDAFNHSIKVTIAGTQNAIGGSPQPLLCPDYLDGFHDNATCTSIEGWAWDSSLPNTPISVDIYDGNTLVTTVIANIFRTDLQSAGIGNGIHGFSVLTPASLKNG